MPTIAMQTRDALRRLFALRLNASVLLVAISFVGSEALLRGALTPLSNGPFLLIVGLTLLAAVLAAAFSFYQLIRYRSLQHLAEVMVAVWLFIRVAEPLARFTGAPVV